MIARNTGWDESELPTQPPWFAPFFSEPSAERRLGCLEVYDRFRDCAVKRNPFGYCAPRLEIHLGVFVKGCGDLLLRLAGPEVVGADDTGDVLHHRPRARDVDARVQQ